MNESTKRIKFIIKCFTILNKDFKYKCASEVDNYYKSLNNSTRISSLIYHKDYNFLVKIDELINWLLDELHYNKDVNINYKDFDYIIDIFNYLYDNYLAYQDFEGDQFNTGLFNYPNYNQGFNPFINSNVNFHNPYGNNNFNTGFVNNNQFQMSKTDFINKCLNIINNTFRVKDPETFAAKDITVNTETKRIFYSKVGVSEFTFTDILMHLNKYLIITNPQYLFSIVFETLNTIEDLLNNLYKCTVIKHQVI